ncbi:hypothetical protein [Gluconobacter cerinus]|uniref:hypothetical protein n=1 Tax=Gluconobacter cerinus TaxID=38307 RepID=UPI001B8AF0A6|nr:hypothetical protein [Gluconobacter cerinus]MBS1068826.1 hypothetical protein [Gluconobacter cerinus]
MSKFKSGLNSMKATEDGRLKVRFTIPEKAGSLEARTISTPEFNVSVVLPEKPFALQNDFITTELEALKLLMNAAERRIQEITYSARS